LVLLLGLTAAANLVAGSVSGRVELRDSKDTAVRKHMDFSGVVVWLEPAAGSTPPASSAVARMVQKDKIFTPQRRFSQFRSDLSQCVLQLQRENIRCRVVPTRDFAAGAVHSARHREGFL
jgi:hypothetical protein